MCSLPCWPVIECCWVWAVSLLIELCTDHCSWCWPCSTGWWHPGPKKLKELVSTSYSNLTMSPCTSSKCYSLRPLLMTRLLEFCFSWDALSYGILFGQSQIFQFWPKTMDYNKAFWLKSRSIFVVLYTPHWKVLWSWNLRHSVPLEMPFYMVSFLAEVQIYSFWPKTMDYNKAFWPKSRSFFVVLLLLTGRCYEAEICAIVFLLRCPFIWYPFWPKSKFSVLAKNHGL